ncbi:MAG: type II CAAX endopeptidase family protein [Armatimonadota bacterium]
MSNPGQGPHWRGVLAIFLGILPWPAAGLGLYQFHSAPLAFVGYHILCFIGGLLLRSPALPPTAESWRFRRRHLLGTILCANAFTLVAYLYVGAALLDKPLVLGLMAKRGLPPSTYFWLFPYFALVNPLAEEFFWRGGVYAALRPSFKSWVPAALLSALQFGAWHWLVIRLFVNPWVALAATALIAGIGFLLALTYERTRRMSYPVILHAFAGDAPLLLLLVMLGRG